MSKVKKSDIPNYELLYLVSNKYTEDELKPIIKNVDKAISEKGGKISSTEEWGKKRLAYPIKQFSHGYYVLVKFASEGEKVSEISRALRMMREVFRHQIVVIKIKSEEEVEKEKEISKKIAAKQAKVEKEKVSTEKEEKKEKSKEKVDLEDLDKKLDNILDTDDLL